MIGVHGVLGEYRNRASQVEKRWRVAELAANALQRSWGQFESHESRASVEGTGKRLRELGGEAEAGIEFGMSKNHDDLVSLLAA